MRREQNVIATTTSTLEGYEIGNYLGVIASHVVAGTNMFSDIFASLSDIFGGRSRTYQNQLAKINDEAVNLLKEKAAAMGGNCIVGLRIDHDEVSGGGKSMFMVTATGTAAKARRTKTMGQDVQNRISMLSATDLSNLLQRKSLVDAAVGNTLVLNRETWEFLCDHQVYEVADYVTVNVAKAIKEPWAFSDNFLDICKSYFMSLPNDHVKRTLYPIMRSTDDSLRAYALDIISKMHLFDYDEVDNLLRSDRFDEQKYGLALLATEKESYGEEDISRLEKMLHLVENGFGM